MLAKNRMQDQIDAGEGKKTFRDYIQAIDNYLIPFFGSYNIDNISYSLLQKFTAWRVEQFAREPASSTITNHNSALNRVFDEAVIRGYLRQSQVPELNNTGKKSERRPAFTLKEYRKLVRYMRAWIRKGKKGKSVQMRYLLRDYVLILANTGIRHGTEAAGLKWKNIQVEIKDGKKYIVMSVSGKTGRRELVARYRAVRYLQRLHNAQEDLKQYSFEALLEAKIDKPVFRLPDGTATANLRQTFAKLLKDSELLLDANTGQNRTLYSLRHTYATFALEYHDIDIHLLAKQMGTSVGMNEQHYSHIDEKRHMNTLAGYDFTVL